MSGRQIYVTYSMLNFIRRRTWFKEIVSINCTWLSFLKSRDYLGDFFTKRLCGFFPLLLMKKTYVSVLWASAVFGARNFCSTWFWSSWIWSPCSLQGIRRFCVVSCYQEARSWNQRRSCGAGWSNYSVLLQVHHRADTPTWISLKVVPTEGPCAQHLVPEDWESWPVRTVDSTGAQDQLLWRIGTPRFSSSLSMVEWHLLTMASLYFVLGGSHRPHSVRFYLDSNLQTLTSPTQAIKVTT